MKINSTRALTVILLVTMLGAGAVSALQGFALGRLALQDVHQPNVDPFHKLGSNQEASSQQKRIIMPESEILESVEAETNKGETGKDAKAKKQARNQE
jgi:hypothetical protein